MPLGRGAHTRRSSTSHLDRFHYITLDLESQEGIFMSCSSGKLPFDAKQDQVFEAGLRMHF